MTVGKLTYSVSAMAAIRKCTLSLSISRGAISVVVFGVGLSLSCFRKVSRGRGWMWTPTVGEKDCARVGALSLGIYTDTR